MPLIHALRRFWCIAGAIVLVACNSSDAVEPKRESIRRGDDHAAKHEYREAIAAYRHAVNSDPRDGAARLKLANAFVFMSDWRQAAPEAVRAADLLPDNVEAQLLAARIILHQTRFIDAADRASAVLKSDPDNATALIIWGNATSHLLNSGWALDLLSAAIRDKNTFDDSRRQLRQPTVRADDVAAEDAFRKAERLAPTMTESQLALANFLWAVGRPDEGEAPLRRVADQNPGDALANRALGAFYFSRQRNTDGERYLRNAATLGGDRLARLALADYYSRQDRDNDARTILQSMTAADDVSGEVTLRLAAIEARASKPRDAVRQLDALLSRAPQNLQALLLKARILLSMGNPDQRYARAAVDRYPRSNEARALLGDVLLDNGDVDRALDEYSEALRLYPDSSDLPLKLARLSLATGRSQVATDYAREALRKNPESRDTAVELVRALNAVGDYDTAERELRPLLTRHPAVPDVLVQAGAVHLGRGDDAAARAAFERALQLHGDSFDALSGLVSLDLKQRRIADARARVDAALAAHPRDVAYLLLAARVYGAAGDASRTESALRQALDVDRANERAALTLADFLAARGRQEEAKGILDQLLQRRPGSLEGQTSLGRLLERMGRPTEARAQYEKTVGHSSRAAVAASRLAALYLDENGNVDLALALASSAKQQLPNDPFVSDVLGRVYVRKNLPLLGLPHLQDAVRAVPTDPRFRFHLASAYLGAGRVKPAQAEFAKALQIDPNFAEAAQARAALASLAK